MNDSLIIAVGLGVLIVLSAAHSLGDVGFLLAVMFIGSGWLAVMTGAYFEPGYSLLGIPLTFVGMGMNYIASNRDINVRWRAAGFHSTVLMAMFTPAAIVAFLSLSMNGDPAVLKPAAIAYTALAVWHTFVALRAAWRVMTTDRGDA